MIKKNIKANVSLLIASDYYGGTTLTVADGTSHIQFLKIKIPQEQLALLLSRHVEIECDAEVYFLENVGKIKESKKIKFELPTNVPYGDDRKKLASRLLDKMAEKEGEGWIADHYFGSQDSFSYDPETNKTYANGYLYRFVETSEGEKT